MFARGNPTPALAEFIDEASFWIPERLVQSAWLEHASFAFWLIKAQRPSRVVELGTHYGFSYFAFCQAVRQLGLETQCFAIDTWKGDEHAGFYGDEVFEEVHSYNERRYASFSRLVRTTFDEAVKSFEDGSIDLLHIDGRHYYQDVKHDFEAWLPKVSDRGVVIIHDTNVREQEFGVSHLWAELCDQYPHFQFFHGHGLGVLAVGPQVSSSVAGLCATEPTIRPKIRDFYHELGKTITSQYGAEQHARRVELERAYAAGEQRTERESQEAVAALDAMRVTAEGLSRTLAERDREHGEAAAALERSRAELDQMRANAAKELEAIRTYLRDSQTKVQRLAGELDGVQRELGAALNDREAISAQLSVSQRRSEEFEGELSKKDGELGVARATLAQKEQELDSYGRTFDVVQSLLEDLRKVAAAQARAINQAPSAASRLAAWLDGLGSRLTSRRSVNYGARAWEADMIRASKLFDAAWYLQRYDDVAAAKSDPLLHYLKHGAAEGRDPHPLFDTKWYVSQYPHVAETGLSPLGHYIILGVSEGLDPNPLFDSDWYLHQYPEVARNHVNPLLHYVEYGASEGRDPHPLFDSSWYLEHNADVKKAGDNPLRHYLLHGSREGRPQHPRSDTDQD